MRIWLAEKHVICEFFYTLGSRLLRLPQRHWSVKSLSISVVFLQNSLNYELGSFRKTSMECTLPKSPSHSCGQLDLTLEPTFSISLYLIKRKFISMPQIWQLVLGLWVICFDSQARKWTGLMDIGSFLKLEGFPTFPQKLHYWILPRDFLRRHPLFLNKRHNLISNILSYT